jgi:hypothetical protein
MGEPLLHLTRVGRAFEFCIHSLANQEVLRWQLAMQNELGDNITQQDIKDYLWKTLKSGQVVPGLVAYFFSCGVFPSKLSLATGMVSCGSRTPASSRFRSSAIADQIYSRARQSSW